MYENDTKEKIDSAFIKNAGESALFPVILHGDGGSACAQLFGSASTAGPTWLLHPDREFTQTVYNNDSTLTAHLNDALTDDCNPPVVNDTLITVNEGDSVTQSVLNLDKDMPDDTTILSKLNDPSFGSISLSPGKPAKFTYTHNGSENFVDTTKLTATDKSGNIDTFTVAINITPMNDNTPVAVKDSIYVVRGGTKSSLVSSATSVLDNDSDIDGMSGVIAELIDSTSCGSLLFNSNGTFEYTHDSSTNLMDSFSYRIADGIHTGNTVIVPIAINANNDFAPVSQIDSITIDRGEATAVLADGNSSVLDNDSDGDGMAGVVSELVDSTVYGSLTFNPNGTFNYIHSGDNILSDSFTYVAFDGFLRGETTAVKITVNEVAIVNQLSMSGSYDTSKKNDTVTITMDSINTLKSNIDSIVSLRLSNTAEMTPLLLDTTFSVSNLIALGDNISINIGGLVTLPILLDTMHMEWNVIGRSSLTGDTKSNSFSYGWPRPVYSGTLSGDSTYSGSEIAFTFTAPTYNVDSIRLLWDVDSLPWTHTTSLPQNQIHYIDPVTKLIDTLSGLNSYTDYYIGLQVCIGGLWSSLSANSTAKVKTSQGDTTTVINNITIDSSFFIENKNSIYANWSIPSLSTHPGKHLEYGWSISTNNSSASVKTPSSWKKATATNSSDTIELGTNILFDTTYTIAYWLRSVDSISGPGQPSAPTPASKCTVSTPPFTWIPLELTFTGMDTISILDGQIILINNTDNTFSLQDTIVKVEFADSICNGFLMSPGSAFKFKTGIASISPILLRIKHSLDSTVNPSIFYSDGMCINAIHQINQNNRSAHSNYAEAFINSSLLPYTFIVMKDTSHFSAVELNSESDFINSGDSIAVNIIVSDNVSNIKWALNAGTGAGAFSYSDTGTSVSSIDSLKIVIPSIANIANEASGTRIQMIISDGTFLDTLNISRRVNTTTSDIFTVEAKKWIPLRATSTLEDPSFSKIFTQVTESEGYNPELIRVARWYDPLGTGNPSIIEYSDNLKTDFALTPGKVVWMKSLNEVSINLGSGVTNSLRSNTEIVLKAQSWNDIATPYKFDVALSDIIANTANGNTLTFYKWEGSATTFNAVPIYIPALDSTGNKLDTAALKYSPANDAWVVYNPLSTDITLSIPPSPIGVRKRVVEEDHNELINMAALNWNDLISGNKGGIKMGFSEQPVGVRGPLPPKFGSLSVSLSDSNNTNCGYILKGKVSEEGAWFPVVFKSGDLSQRKITYSINELRGNSDLSIHVFDPDKNEYVNVDSDTVILSGNNSHKERIIVLGSSEYINGFKEKLFVNSFNLNQVYPNPFKGTFNLKFTVPWNNIKKLSIKLIDLKGRTIFSKDVSKQFNTGINNLNLNMESHSGTRLSSGVYILRVSAFELDGKIKRFERKLTCIR